jgi:hypothetical protein
MMNDYEITVTHHVQGYSAQDAIERFHDGEAEEVDLKVDQL